MLPISVILPTIPIPAHLRRNQARKQLGAVFRTIIANRRANGVRENDALQVSPGGICFRIYEPLSFLDS
jgi:sterol 14-demethylase